MEDEANFLIDTKSGIGVQELLSGEDEILILAGARIPDKTRNFIYGLASAWLAKEEDTSPSIIVENARNVFAGAIDIAEDLLWNRHFNASYAPCVLDGGRGNPKFYLLVKPEKVTYSPH